MEGYKIYVLKSEIDGRLYVGLSQNVNKRLADHKFGRVFATKGYRPWKLIYSEFIGSRKHARRREKFLKSGCGKEYLKFKLTPR